MASKYWGDFTPVYLVYTITCLFCSSLDYFVIVANFNSDQKCMVKNVSIFKFELLIIFLPLNVFSKNLD